MFDSEKMETDMVIQHDGVAYRIIDTGSSGMLIVAKEDDVKSNNYPIPLFTMPVTDSLY
ncbi:hypothetical protein OYT88_06355 [Sporolactobacillus sp. CQH2019]|uniref:hypothetical protein n=1 Tax=Sporolactobacillus sp. CQH2019 TaxID=3023512 RepID=UPI002367561D|nr:hypothetical protein [Sporolactobacillus sp. CQH2019]MDD9148168.1 hypothetical protein [Sporolactobacillus sp. CQH2019]